MDDREMLKTRNILMECQRLISDDTIKDQNDLDDLSAKIGKAIIIIENRLNTPEDFWKVGGTI